MPPSGWKPRSRKSRLMFRTERGSWPSYCDDFIIAPYRLLGQVASAVMRDGSVGTRGNTALSDGIAGHCRCVSDTFHIVVIAIVDHRRTHSLHVSNVLI